MFRGSMLLGSGLLLALSLGVSGVTAASGDRELTGKSAKFNPKKVKGHWSGTWKNHTFKSTGPATMDIKVRGKGKRRKFIGVFDLGGNAFGCPDPDPRKVTMKRGKGPKSWNSKGFKATWKNDNGRAHIKYRIATKKFSGDGFSPCASSIAYSYTGKMTNTQVNAEVEITNEGEPFAESTLSMRKERNRKR